MHEMLKALGLTEPMPVPLWEMFERDERDERRLHEIRQAEKCGGWGWFVDPQTGGMQASQIFCGKWRICPTCLDRRMEKMKYRLVRIERHVERVGIVQKSEESVRKICRQMRDAGVEYYRVPMEDACLLFYDAEVFGLESELSLGDLDLEEIVRTPRGKRASGKLGAGVKQAIEGESFVVSVKHVTVEIDPMKRIEALKATDVDLPDLHPECNEQEIELACALVMDTFIRHIERLGGKVTSSRILRRRVLVSTYTNWIIDTKAQELEMIRARQRYKQMPLAA